MSDPATPSMDHLTQSLAQVAEGQRAFLQDITLFARDESLRFVNLRLERNGAALEKLQNCQGLQGLFSVQQEWLRDMLQDYAAANMRLAGTFRGLAQNGVTTAGKAASDMMHQAQDTARQTGEQAADTAENAVQQMPDYGNDGNYQETQH